LLVEDGIAAQHDPAEAGITDFPDTGTNGKLFSPVATFSSTFEIISF
jgi:hypothetical protein